MEYVGRADTNEIPLRENCGALQAVRGGVFADEDLKWKGTVENGSNREDQGAAGADAGKAEGGKHGGGRA